jgi:hypothetical protein
MAWLLSKRNLYKLYRHALYDYKDIMLLLIAFKILMSTDYSMPAKTPWRKHAIEYPFPSIQLLLMTASCFSPLAGFRNRKGNSGEERHGGLHRRCPHVDRIIPCHKTTTMSPGLFVFKPFAQRSLNSWARAAHNGTLRPCPWKPAKINLRGIQLGQGIKGYNQGLKYSGVFNTHFMRCFLAMGFY